MTNPTCQERIDQEYQGRMDDLRKLWAGYTGEDCPECDGLGEVYEGDTSIECKYCEGTGHVPEDVPDLGSLYEYGLSFDYVAPHTFKNQDEGYFRYQLSWGGPSDEFRIYANRISEYTFAPYKIEYWFLDWFDGAHVLLTGEDRKFISNLFESIFEETGTAEHVFQEAMENYEPEDDDELEDENE